MTYIDACKRTTNSYTGDNAVNRAIAHGLDVIPKFINIESANGVSQHGLIQSGKMTYDNMSSFVQYSVTAWDSTNFYIGVSGSEVGSANSNGVVYHWVAIA